jgi:hypothetical protein
VRSDEIWLPYRGVNLPARCRAAGRVDESLLADMPSLVAAVVLRDLRGAGWRLDPLRRCWLPPFSALLVGYRAVAA